MKLSLRQHPPKRRLALRADQRRAVSIQIPLVEKNENFRKLIQDVRIERAKKEICKSAQPGVDMNELLNRIVEEEVFREDYEILTSELLEERISYEESITAIKEIIKSEYFI